MIYQQGKLIVGEDWIYFEPFTSIRYISRKDNFLSGVLTYDPTERNICFFPSRRPKKPEKPKKEYKIIKQAKPTTEEEVVKPPIESLFFNIDKTNFELAEASDSINKYHFVRITTENNEKYLFTSEINVNSPTSKTIAGTITGTLIQRTYWLGKQFVYNNSIIKIINYLKSK